MRCVTYVGYCVVMLAISLISQPAEADAVAVVSVTSPLTTLSRSQVEAIFLGRTSRLPNGVQALPIDQTEGSAIRNEFYTRLVGQTAAQLKAYWWKINFTGRGQPPPTVPDSIEMKKRLVANPCAIGYIDQSMVDDSVRVVL